MPQSSIVDCGAGKLNLTTTFTYDAIGNLTLVDGPRTDVRDTLSVELRRRAAATQITMPWARSARWPTTPTAARSGGPPQCRAGAP